MPKKKKLIKHIFFPKYYVCLVFVDKYVLNVLLLLPDVTLLAALLKQVLKGRKLSHVAGLQKH